MKKKLCMMMALCCCAASCMGAFAATTEEETEIPAVTEAVAVEAHQTEELEDLVEEEPVADVVIANKDNVSVLDLTAEDVTDEGEIILEGEPGETYVIGDLIYKFVTEEEMEEALSNDLARGSTRKWTITLSGSSFSKKIPVTADDPYVKVWINSTGASSVQFTITQGSTTGAVVSGSAVTIPAGSSPVSVYSTNKWTAGTYYANYTSGKSDLAGTSACRLASTVAELDM